ncbi:uncharacterized protein LY89DRAFT_681200 [Mollisia scopiformis]|uniref:Peptidase S59 domain-containing protein n=1 Tax=Mollisia scopiformis TaxID=149040 RepID=A0A194XNS0_MOLSC|nr:uncharacterized protein LY89DRAFT_681200 [Mollisia scopiformis]KUJ21806.1 hypothetical protein LY89DRAFT_681200 [Mollisia scopiformis]
MSGFGGFGFGANNNNQQPQNTGFGGFGAANNTTNTGFGTGNTGFGSTNNNTTGGLFGGGSTGGFGSSGGAFGSTSNNAFGAKPSGFGGTTTSAGTSLFGGTTATAGSGGFGGFGGTPASGSSPFGGNNNTGGSLFGANKPAFGNAASTSGPFGGGASSGFGGNTGAFGSPASTALGATTGECQGTGSVPFQAFVEKEPNSSTNQQNAFQSICFQQPYQKFSPEELRLADYNQGRKFGNASNQAGAFGTTNFGGFGTNNTANTGFGAANTNTGSNLFGGGASNTSFGASQPASTGFGAANNTASTGLFGAKPAGGLFGAQPAAQPSGGLFGNSNNTGFGANTGGFGSTNTTTTNSLFGNSNTANKPAFSFGGAASTPASTGTGFGASTTPSAFGGGGSLFGGNNAQQTATTSFGTQQPAATTGFGFGGSTTQNTGNTSLFGGNQQKPTAGLFGAPASNTGLFGNTQPAANTNAFGGSTNTSTSTGLFGNKPAGTNLFGNSTPQNNNSGSNLFGGGFGAQNQNQTQNQPATGGSTLFGLSNNNQQKPSLFGNTNSQQQGGLNLFGTTGNQQQGNNLFGSLNNNQQQQPSQPSNSLFSNSMFNTSQQGQQNQQALTASIGDNGAFGSSSLFANLASTQVNNPGPIATPLSSSVKQKRAPAALPMYKLSTPSASRFSTPTKRGFGFSYSTYGTPGSASSTASTPGTFSSSLLSGGTFNRTLSKSVSTSSLRRSLSTEDNILAPGAFSSSSSVQRFGSTGSVKKLNINRSLRQDLFSPPNAPPQQNPSTPLPGILKKRVSFGGNGNGSESPLKQVDNVASPSSENMGYLRPPPGTNGTKLNGTHSQQEMEQVTNERNQLTIVREEEPAPPVQPPTRSVSQEDQEPGEYWMKPTKAEIEGMSRVQRSKVEGFTIGRKGIGHIRFNVPVDLTKLNIDDIIGNIVTLNIRSATVYSNPAKKPPMGQGLNVPATIALENSWPRKKDLKTPTGEKSGTRFKKHIERLKKVPDTNFLSYDKDSGIWEFSVEHFTTYGFPEDDDETDLDRTSEFGQSTLSAPPDTPTPKTRTPGSARHDQSFASTSQLTTTDSDPDDTFEFRTKRKPPPGAFDEQVEYVGDEMDEEYDEGNQESFLDERSVGSPSENGVEEPMDQDDVFHDGESVSIVDQDMAGSYPEADNTAELGEDSQDDEDMDVMAQTPGVVMRARLRASKIASTPTKFSAGDDWANTLKKTVSPQKQDRALLKSLIDIHGNEQGPEPTPMPRRHVSDGRGFATSIDLMNSLFGQARSPIKTAKNPVKPKGFEWPYPKRTKTGDHDMSPMDDTERAFHDSMKPSWGVDGTLVYAAPPNAKPFGRSSRRIRNTDGLLAVQIGGVVSENRDVRFAKFSNEASAAHLEKHKQLTQINNSNRVPSAGLDAQFTFSELINLHTSKEPAAVHEKLVWQLASILFDEMVIPEELRDVPKVKDRLRKDKLSIFWQSLVDEASSKHVALGRDEEEKAIACLSGHKIAEACDLLVNSGDYHLATLVALIGSQDSIRQDMRQQLNDWQKSNVLSEFSQPIRAIYEIISGNVSVCDGQKGDIENRTESFIISKRFGLDWRQAFGLRLWYGLSTKEPIDAAVEAFATDLSQDKETAKPVPWYIEQKLPVIWEDRRRLQRQDLLWGLLKLFSFDNIDLEDILCPENSQLSPLDVRLNWQLCQALTTARHVQFTETDGEKVDRLTLSFAAQLSNEGSWLDAVFVLLHLSHSDARETALQDHLARHAGLIGEADSQAFSTLIQTYKIPADWIWEAKALYMRSVEKDPRAEVECLINAGAYNEAHRTFAKEVAPLAVIELDYTTIRNLILGFSGKEDTIAEWHLGGEIYTDFLRLLDAEKHGSVDDLVLERLLAGLPAVLEEARHPSFMETVAIETISGVVAKTVVAMGKNGEKSNLHKILRLPLTEDKFLKHTVELSLEYYRGLMTSAR